MAAEASVLASALYADLSLLAYNLVEDWFALLTQCQLQRGVFETTGDLESAIHANIDLTNAKPKPSIGIKSADAILASVKRF